MFWKTSSQLFCSLAWCWGSSEAGHLLGSTSQSSVEAQRRRTTCPAVQHSQMGQDHAIRTATPSLRLYLQLLQRPVTSRGVPNSLQNQSTPKAPPTTRIQVIQIPKSPLGSPSPPSRLLTAPTPHLVSLGGSPVPPASCTHRWPWWPMCFPETAVPHGLHCVQAPRFPSLSPVPGHSGVHVGRGAD